jgi:hypothetical protein
MLRPASFGVEFGGDPNFDTSTRNTGTSVDEFSFEA